MDSEIQYEPPNAAALSGWNSAPLTMDRTTRTGAPNQPTSQPTMVGTDQENATVHPDCDRAASLPGPHKIHPWTTVSQQPRPGRPDWTTVTLVSDSFPRKRKPPPRVTLLVGMTHQRAECRVNLRAGVRVSPSGTPPGPYSAYTCPSPGATDWS